VALAADKMAVGDVAFIVSVTAVLAGDAEDLTLPFKIVEGIIDGGSGDGGHNLFHLFKKLVCGVMLIRFANDVQYGLALLSYDPRLLAF
jgi:hypothetical protein